MSSDSVLTCITCRVGFKDLDLQREHYKSDWHRYNLKRKIVDLPSVTFENFHERALAQEALNSSQEKDTSQYCTICKKIFGNEKVLKSHLVSKKHLQAVKENSMIESEIPKAEEKIIKPEEEGGRKGKKFPPAPEKPIIKNEAKSKNTTAAMEVGESDEEDGDWEEIEGNPILATNCLFCEHESDDIESNLNHMSTLHSFFIPDIEYCIDLEGLLEYLGEKVGEGMVCLWCNEKGRQFYSIESVQQHMRDKGHCKILHEGESLFEFAEYYDYSESYPEGADVNPDEAYQPEPMHFNEDMQLVLPSGVTLGHRSLKVYYKQYIRPTKDVVLHRAAKKNKILNQYKAIGYGPISVHLAQERHRDQKYFKLVRDKYRVKLGIKGNKILQKHFRSQVPNT